MKNPRNGVNRRDFIINIGAFGLGSTFALAGCKKEPEIVLQAYPDESKGSYPQVPKRRLGKTDVKVPCLSHGIMYNLIENQIVIHNALKWGINFIDTAHGYAGGNSELGVGKFFTKYPDRRDDIFIVSKASGASSISEVENRLQTSLKRMNTKYIDLYYGIHALSDPADLTDDLKKWVISAKNRKLIRHFGISTHKNMAKCLMAVAKLDWIDAVMTSYNFRLMQNPEMQEAIEACHKADIGLIAMKIMGLKISSDDDRKLINKFRVKGYTDGQAKLKVVLDDSRIASACVTMPSVAMITTNASAVIDKKRLSRKDRDILKDYAKSSCDHYCAGCADICSDDWSEAAPYISDIMRYLMYYNSYNEQEKAKILFSKIPAQIRRGLMNNNYSEAEAKCPQKIPIKSMISEAVEKLAS
ncbi:MAG: aldo/keto reductase [Spirochaetota bacterium]|nr:aldo/keto reductase [Spirochaetota bacterium]